MEKSENRLKEEQAIINKIQSIFDNADLIDNFEIVIIGGAGEITAIEYRVAERIVPQLEEKLMNEEEITKSDVDLNPKCGSCKWLNKEKKTCVGYVCENPNKKWRTSTAQYKQKKCKACKEYIKKEYEKENEEK